jgi:predicted metal-dependent RNase
MSNSKTPPDRSHGRKSVTLSAAPRDLMSGPQRLAHAWRVQVITLMPQAFPGILGESLTGRALQDGRDPVRLDGRPFDVAAHVHQLSGYSAHGDQQDLIEFVEGFEEPPGQIRLVHGEWQPKRVLQQELERRGYHVD